MRPFGHSMLVNKCGTLSQTKSKPESHSRPCPRPRSRARSVPGRDVRNVMGEPQAVIWSGRKHYKTDTFHRNVLRRRLPAVHERDSNAGATGPTQWNSIDQYCRSRFSNVLCRQDAGGTHGEMHGRLTDGGWVTGVKVFRQLYSAVGFGPVVWLTRRMSNSS
jgi:hypothetical protein